MTRWPSRLLRRSRVVFLSNVILRDDSAAYLIGLDIILHLSYFVFQSFFTCFNFAGIAHTSTSSLLYLHTLLYLH